MGSLPLGIIGTILSRIHELTSWSSIALELATTDESHTAKAAILAAISSLLPCSPPPLLCFGLLREYLLLYVAPEEVVGWLEALYLARLLELGHLVRAKLETPT